METITSLFAILAGLLLRLAIPIAGTILLIYVLRKLDAHWQAEAGLGSAPIENTECWKLRGSAEEPYKDSAGAASALPCWQVYRQPNGYLQENCLSCEVFINAPIPALKTEPRRM